jgi:hypothetical protein
VAIFFWGKKRVLLMEYKVFSKYTRKFVQVLQFFCLQFFKEKMF